MCPKQEEDTCPSEGPRWHERGVLGHPSTDGESRAPAPPRCRLEDMPGQLLEKSLQNFSWPLVFSFSLFLSVLTQFFVLLH